jgi:hypothetical protein
MCLGSKKIRIHASGFGCTVEAHICKKGQKIKSYMLKSQGTAREVERLTLQGFSKILDLLKKEFLAVYSIRRLRQSNVDFGSNYPQLTLRILELVTQRLNQHQFTRGRRSSLNGTRGTANRFVRNGPSARGRGGILHEKSGITHKHWQPNVKQINRTEEQVYSMKGS